MKLREWKIQKLLKLKCLLTKFTIGFGVGEGFLWLFSFHFLVSNGCTNLLKDKETSTFGLLESKLCVSLNNKKRQRNDSASRTYQVLYILAEQN